MMSATLPPVDASWLASLDEATLHETLLARVEAAWRVALDVHPDLPRPRVWLDLRGKGAGQAHFTRGGLRFNPVLLRENRQAFMEDVVPHEMAHWLVFHLDGPPTRPHGHEWRTVMQRLYGLPPRTTHRFDVSRASPAPYVYRCGCDTEHRFSARRHARARRGTAYRCRYCRQRLRFVAQNACNDDVTQ
ncbi:MULTISPECIES: SprT family zinc-dependent metalloprotease [Chromohalobacter]|jgi:SprT protein|uniref:SprT-like domain-containing protein n=2 Tax=Chromohalobacter israelensis TaxID=141390 RepID=Q1QZ87_CHRI1|nr:MULTISPECIES: SprT-like domain-containing protein [Chromohalobacter]ABE58221.1 Protein of unknown function SprT [Chromohalobacter salexigens DSM 3043]MBZ5875715.1 SprT-like domain-containing protein [Chromohalobacter salexigens]MDF9433332.1 SprT-like domain-containing protein [Chromohalobacter israelensis]MDO0944296.1 SprT-like domain-containing protein [Chromohalobacter salexigens]NQY45874.1 SprT-like domain-containing protein [Chromohalobacter sp.]